MGHHLATLNPMSLLSLIKQQAIGIVASQYSKDPSPDSKEALPDQSIESLTTRHPTRPSTTKPISSRSISATSTRGMLTSSLPSYRSQSLPPEQTSHLLSSAGRQVNFYLFPDTSILSRFKCSIYVPSTTAVARSHLPCLHRSRLAAQGANLTIQVSCSLQSSHSLIVFWVPNRKKLISFKVFQTSWAHRTMIYTLSRTKSR